MNRAWYEASIAVFLITNASEVLGRLAENNQFALLGTQRNAWLEQIAFLKRTLTGLSGSIYLEFSIPRIGRRIDVVLVIGPVEDAATEFQVQGLEVDWACVTWDGDLRFNETGWSYHDFRGDRWINVRDADNRRYLLNAYRVLLTRARQGMVIFVPKGNSQDPTRPPQYYDSTFNYLTDLGIPTLF